MTEFDKQVAHLTRLATTPGWWQYARCERRSESTESLSAPPAVKAVPRSRGMDAA